MATLTFDGINYSPEVDFDLDLDDETFPMDRYHRVMDRYEQQQLKLNKLACWDTHMGANSDVEDGHDVEDGYGINADESIKVVSDPEDFVNQPVWVQNFQRMELTDEEWDMLHKLGEMPDMEFQVAAWRKFVRMNGLSGRRNSRTAEWIQLMDKIADLRSDSFVRLTEYNLDGRKRVEWLARLLLNRVVLKRLNNPTGWDRFLQDNYYDYD